MDTDRMKDLVDRYLAGYNAFDIDGMLALLSPDVRFENHSGGQLTAAATGMDEFRELAGQSRQLFLEREQRILDISFGQDSAVATIAWRGRLAVDIPEGPPAGPVLELQGTSEFSFANGRISRLVDRS